MAERDLSLLNLFEVESEGGGSRHLICFLDPVLAGATGIDMRAVVGEYTPDSAGKFDPKTLALNPAFVTALTLYMNAVTASAPELIEPAKSETSGWLYLLDPRYKPNSEEAEPPAHDVLGCFAVDETGQIVPGSFQYNSHHTWFDATEGASGLLQDRRFYDWLHRMDERNAGVRKP